MLDFEEIWSVFDKFEGLAEAPNTGDVCPKPPRGGPEYLGGPKSCSGMQKLIFLRDMADRSRMSIEDDASIRKPVKER